MSTPELTVAFVTGASPEKWFRRFRDRTGVSLRSIASDDPGSLLQNGAVDMAILRVHNAEVAELFGAEFHTVHLYEEAWGVVFEKEHVFSLLEEVPAAELEGETILLQSADPVQQREMMSVVATGAGIALGPRPLLRGLAKKAVDTRDVIKHAQSSQMWLVWPKAHDDDIRQEFVGIVHGRREGSTRGDAGARTTGEGSKKMSAREKTLAKQARRQANAGSARSSSTRSGSRSGNKLGKSGGARSSRGKRR